MTRISEAKLQAAGGDGIVVMVRMLPHGQDLPLPSYHSEGAAGMDLAAAIGAGAPLILAPGERRLIPTGLAIRLPHGYEAQVRPRSGIAARFGVTVLNAPGTVDADYRGEVMVLLINLGQEPFTLRRGDRIAQLVIQPVARARLEISATLDDTPRGDGGFGSTGR
jgi:dUTP pyrophosphatase